MKTGSCKVVFCCAWRSYAQLPHLKENYVNKFSRTARSVTFAAIVGLSLGVSAPGAFATTGADANVLNEGISTINNASKGTLTIHKQGLSKGEKPLPEERRTGEIVQDAPGKPLPGAEFTLFEIFKNGVRIDLKSNQSIADAVKVQRKDWVKKDPSNWELNVDGVTYTAKKKESKTTNAEGQGPIGVAQWDSLELGAYLVVETKTPEGFIGSSPFVAFVPMTAANKDAAGTQWNYDVHAYPKNTPETDVDKKVKDKNQNSGDKQLVYTIDAEVRAFAEDEKELTFYTIEDKIDPKLKVTKVEVFKASENITSQEGLKVTGAGENNVVVDFTGAALKSLKGGDKIQVVITTEVLDPKEDISHIPNSAQVYENKPGQNQDDKKKDKPKDTPFVHTFWGGIEFKKVDKGHAPLPGAKFKIIRVKAQYDLGNSTKLSDKTCAEIDAKKINEDDAVNGAQMVNDQGEIVEEADINKVFVSDKNGMVKVTGLHVNDFEDNAEVGSDSQSAYCLVETEAPAGKELLSKAIPFHIVAVPQESPKKPTEKDYTREYKLVTDIQVGDTPGEVVNLDDTTPQLPLTGGAGVGILAAIGAAIIGAGAWFARRNSAES
ncbi:isopeptide-forming domain-containing fimbrial protein [Corynebacterium diphtheriae]|nr:isopeptide-forming domain-containing fimbrial protein [Corynebacterium diphtheriae]